MENKVCAGESNIALGGGGGGGVTSGPPGGTKELMIGANCQNRVLIFKSTCEHDKRTSSNSFLVKDTQAQLEHACPADWIVKLAQIFYCIQD